MRIRTVKPQFFQDERLYDIEMNTGLPIRVIFIGLWCVADREGRFDWNPRRLKVQILPHDECVDFGAALEALREGGFIFDYHSGGKDFGCIPGFRSHQVINNRESPSSRPAPASDGPEASTVETPAVKKPSAKKAVVEKPSAKKTVAEKPSAKKTVAEEPSAKKTVAEEPSAKRTVAEEPVVEKPVADRVVTDLDRRACKVLRSLGVSCSEDSLWRLGGEIQNMIMNSAQQLDDEGVARICANADAWRKANTWIKTMTARLVFSRLGEIYAYKPPKSEQPRRLL
jgi:hypothetical protein